MKIAVIGAGMAGLSAATLLNPHHQVSVFDKGRGVGGRLSHRHRGDFDFDHGAQYLTVRDERFTAFLKTHCQAESFSAWQANFVSIEDGKISSRRRWQEDHLVGKPAMNGLAKSLAQNLEVATNTKISEISPNDDKWQLIDDNNKQLGLFDWVICSAPAEQTKALLPQNCSFLKQLESIHMKPCFTLMLGFNESPITDFDAAHVTDEVLSWISCNHSKPGRITKPSLVVNSTNAWAAKHLELDLEEVKHRLIATTERVLCKPLSPSHTDLHRWRYANVGIQSGPQAFVDKKAKLAAIGDWCIKGRVESAFLSALSLSESLQAQEEREDY